MIAAEHELHRFSGARWTATLLVAATLLGSGLGCRRPGTAPAFHSIPAQAGAAESGVRLNDGRELANFGAHKARIVEFHDSGEWEEQIDAITAQARERLDSELATARRPAIVLDVDDTALSTFAVQRRLGFGWVPSHWTQWVESGVAPPHPGVLALYRHALDRGVAVFFITGRRERLREATERQLRAAGYDRWAGLYLKPDDYTEWSVVPYKAGVRRAIEEQGSEIVLNMGDQWSDLKGGFARATYKLPNPMYYSR